LNLHAPCHVSRVQRIHTRDAFDDEIEAEAAAAEAKKLI
jgi:hypothetical protein